jgi:monofunctional chorismate mutase
MKTIETLRLEYDTIDTQIVTLLEARFELSEVMGQLKESTGLSFYDPERERQVFDKLKNALANPQYFPQIQAVYQRIFEVSKYIQSHPENR